ncbi:hypothetical protein CPB85DRAFT_1411641 [Mucidula mucida]|nr:hypothetical protein CPB85DRAFT_1411641 [Mucidula mucida]
MQQENLQTDSPTALLLFPIPSALDHLKAPLRDVCKLHPGKRLTRAAEEDILPNMYELPGGNIEPLTDPTIFHTVAREALQETGLVVSAVLGEFQSFEYATKRGEARQLNFLVHVEAPCDRPIPTLSPSEHQAYIWIDSVESLDSLPMTDGMKEVVGNALTAMSGLDSTEQWMN